MWWLVILTLATAQVDSVRFDSERDCISARAALEPARHAGACVYFPYVPLS